MKRIVFKQETGAGQEFRGDAIINGKPVVFMSQWFSKDGHGWHHRILTENLETGVQSDGLNGSEINRNFVGEELDFIDVESTDDINFDLAIELSKHAMQTRPKI
jgi:hypothetical protein